MSKHFTYYPGCSLEGTAREYDESFRAICSALNIELSELEDWSCCGASSAHSLSAHLTYALPARNLRLAQQHERDIVTPCTACWTRLRAARQQLAPDYPRVLSAPDVILEFVDELRSQTQLRLERLNVVTYYGCLSVRPVGVTEHPHPEDPQELDRIVAGLGARVKPWSYKTDCCGGSLTLASSEAVTTLADKLLVEAEAAGAEAIVTACPMCSANLEMRRSDSAPLIPVIYFTELIGIAIGHVDAPKWLRRHLISTGDLLNTERADRGVTR